MFSFRASAMIPVGYERVMAPCKADFTIDLPALLRANIDVVPVPGKQISDRERIGGGDS